MSKENADLRWLEQLKQKAAQLHAEESAVTDRIRTGFVSRAIIFMDVVGSTAFKVEHSDAPERWILRVQQFSELMAMAVRNSNGVVVKFIGDEIMATFENVYDAQNLVARIPEIEENLRSATGFETRIKVVADFGSVYELAFEGHEAADPQGSAVDRCARIAKYGLPGEVLASSAFAEKTSKLSWVKVGSVELKGLGLQVIFQLERKTADIEPRQEVKRKDYEALVEERDELRTRTSRLEEQNRCLQQQLTAVGKLADPKAIASKPGEEEAWAPFEKMVKEFGKLIDGCPGPSNRYARFIFLYHANKGYETYNQFEGRTFDELYEANLVLHADGKYYELNPEHPRNKKVLSVLSKVEKTLGNYLAEHAPDPNDLFEWSLDDAEFWNQYIGYNVL